MAEMPDGGAFLYSRVQRAKWACLHTHLATPACSGWLCMVYMIEIVCIKVHQAVHKNFNTVHGVASFLYRMRLFYTISERITRQMRGKSRQFVTVRGAGKTGGKQTSSLLVRLFSVSFPHRANARCFLSGYAGQEDTPPPDCPKPNH